MVDIKRFPRETRHRAATCLTRMVLALPDCAAYGLARGMGQLLARVHPRRAWVLEHLTRAFGDEMDSAAIRRLAQRYFAHITLTFVEIIRLSEWSREKLVGVTDLLGMEHVAAAQAVGKGAVVLTGHLGNWEVAAAAMASRGYPVALVAKPQRSTFLQERLTASRRRHNVEVIPMDNPRACFEWMRRGGGVALAIDQRLRRGGVEVPLFGHPGRAHSGPATLALRTGAPVLMVAARRVRPGRHQIRFEPVPVAQTGDRQHDIEANTARFQLALEQAIRRCPEQWIWEYRIWRQARSRREGQERRRATAAASAPVDPA